MSSFNLVRRKSNGATLDDLFEHHLKFGSLFQLAIFLPYFVFYLFSSTILSAFFRGGRSIWWTILALYTLTRLLIGFVLVVTFRSIGFIIECILSFIDSLFIDVIRSKKETDLLYKLQTSCRTYSDFYKIGQDLDSISSSIQKWKSTPTCDDFDYELLELQLKTMTEIIENKKSKNNNININKLQQTISHVFRRTFCSLHNGNLYNTYCYIGTKYIIEKYYKCLSECVELICDSAIKNKNNNDSTIEYFYRCKRSLGRTALCLSGGGSLSMTHCGVIRVLILNNCLPKVISGTSGGAILAGYLACLTNEEIKSNIDEHFGYKIANQYGTRFLPTFFEQLFGAYRDRVLMPDTSYFINSIKNYVGNLTFKEAWIKTGRHVSISVSYSTKNSRKSNNKYNFKHKHAHYILLNHITSPNVYIWSAITASCALPGLMKPQQLWSKNENNTEINQPYYPDGIQWVDGSLQADIPIKLLQELFRVNYTIVSQVNPHVTPFIINKIGKQIINKKTNQSFGLKVLEMLDDMASQTVNHQLDRLVKLKAIPAVYGHNFDKFALQNFTGDITIVPRIPLNLRFKILSHPTDQDMIQYIDIGEKATWIHLKHIQYVLKIENLIDKVIIRLKKNQSINHDSKSQLVIENDNDKTPPLNK